MREIEEVRCAGGSPVTKGSLDSTRKRQMLGESPWMSRSSTCSPYSSAARSLPIAAASLRTCQKVTLRDRNLVSWNRAKHAEGNSTLYNERSGLL